MATITAPVYIEPMKTSLIHALMCAAIGAGTALPAGADVYKTTDATGRVTYSDEVVPDGATLRLYDSAGIVPATPVKPDVAGFARRRDVRLRREALEDRLRAARARLESAQSALLSGEDITESSIGPDQLADIGATGVIGAYATPIGGGTTLRPALSGQGGTAASRTTVSAGGGVDPSGLALGTMGGLAPPGFGPTASGGAGVTGGSLTPTGGAGNRVGGPRARAASRYADKVETLTREVVQREAEVEALTAALDRLR